MIAKQPAPQRPGRTRIGSWIGIAAGLALLGGLACAPERPESIDAANLAGRWTLDTGAETEWFQLDPDGSFRAEIREDGFLAQTLSEGSRVEATGRWSLADRTLRFAIEASDDDALVGGVHRYEIESLTDRELRTTDARGRRTVLLR